ncbi:hypothetical protein C8R47DRAFT_1095371 [Mycena vitilis]|nr:hypothetical protein C8R47DRAFT_1095371 [Mycena vitilis]
MQAPARGIVLCFQGVVGELARGEGQFSAGTSGATMFGATLMRARGANARRMDTRYRTLLQSKTCRRRVIKEDSSERDHARREWRMCAWHPDYQIYLRPRTQLVRGAPRKSRWIRLTCTHISVAILCLKLGDMHAASSHRGMVVLVLIHIQGMQPVARGRRLKAAGTPVQRRESRGNLWPPCFEREVTSMRRARTRDSQDFRKVGAASSWTGYC